MSWLALLILVWTFVSPGLNDDLECGPLSIEERIECGQAGGSAEHCEARGCCFDPTFLMCYFPTACEELVTLDGGYSAYMVLPGRDVQGSMSMGGNLCSRRLKSNPSHSVEFRLGGRRQVFVLVNSGLRNPFHIKFKLYSSHRRRWEDFEDPFDNSTSDASIDNSLVHSFGGRDVFNFTASQLRIQPKRTHHNPCVTMTLVTCPAPEEPAPVNVTTPPPPTRPPYVSPYVSPDSRPTAIFFGSVAIVVLLAMLALVIVVDLPAFKRDFCIMYKNLKHFKGRISDWRAERRTGRTRKADRELEDVREGETRTSLLAVNDTNRTYRYIEDANC